jgi:hypothetical protein
MTTIFFWQNFAGKCLFSSHFPEKKKIFTPADPSFMREFWALESSFLTVTTRPRAHSRRFRPLECFVLDVNPPAIALAIHRQ